MNNLELKLIIKRLDISLGMNKEEIKHWLIIESVNQYLNCGLFHHIINKIDILIDSKDKRG
jgi:hypothetical protein